MNFNHLYLLQKELDAEIHLNHHTDYASTMSERLMAFLVELGELANETRCFKYWSLKGPSEDKVILEEYSDGIHFILSLGIALNCDINKDYLPIGDNKKLTNIFIDVYSLAIELSNHFDLSHYIRLFETFLGLGSRLGFSYDTICSAYLAKNVINHQRQKDAY